MFKENNENGEGYLKHMNSSQIANSSIDEQYMSDVLSWWDPYLRLGQCNEMEDREIKPFDSQLSKIDEKYNRLMLMVESTWQKLSNTIDIILSNQNAKERLGKANEF